MPHVHWKVRSACALMIASVLTACNSSSSAPVVVNDPDPIPPAAIEGIATPSSVAVVTATHTS